MKHVNTMKALWAAAILLFSGQGVQAQCSFTGLDSTYCIDAEADTLIGAPDGGVFAGTGMTDNIFNPADAGVGTHLVSYTYSYGTDKVYLRSNVGEPWSSSSNTDAMDLAFGSGEWTLELFETIDVASVFSPSTGLVFIDGSDDNALELNAFLTANLATIEAWVSAGGRLLLNSAPNEGTDMDFGFGGSNLVYSAASSSVTVVDLAHPAFVGPLTPTAATMTGSSYSHAHVTGTGFTSILTQTGDATNIVLCEKAWGAGRVMMGGMTTPNFHSPATESLNWRANLLTYLANQTSNYYVRSNVGEPWGSSSNTDAMDLAFGVGEWSLEFFETLDPAAVFSNSTAFVFIDGSDDNAAELATFLSTNLTLIENWVNDGGSLILNSAPNEGGDIDFGFDGTTLVYADASSSVDIVDLTHPAYLGPNTPTAATMTGGSYSHAHITGTDYTSVLTQTGDATNIVLCEKAWGDGHVMMGGMTTANFHSPSTEAANWRANIMVYMAGLYGGATCTSTQEVTVYELPVVEATADVTEACLGDSVVFAGAGAETYTWDMGVTDGIAFLPGLGTETYTVTGTDVNGCMNTASIDVTVNDLPAVTASVDTDFICFGESAVFTGGGAESYAWDMGVTDGVAFTPADAGTETYTVTGTDANGCMNMASVELTMNEEIVIAFTTGDETMGSDGEIDITVTGGSPAYTYDWDNDGTGDFDDSEDLTGLVAGTYIVVVEDEAGCTATETIVVDSQVGIRENGTIVAIYPNPTVENLTVQFNGTFVYELSAINGDIIMTGQAVDQEELSLNGLASGVYFMTVKANGNVNTVKVIKK